ncbi:MAG: pantetheine-phosphate adenylyltransferase [Caldisericia bacterium]|nr:pantetheine-phosphate adenylyltransferase [Caldisericia bacterium]
MEGQNLASCKPKNSKRAVYPGSFDPLTFGHIDLIERSLGIFDEITILIAENRKKSCFLSTKERITITKEYFKENPRIKVETWNELLIDYMKENNIPVCIRGLRVLSDFENEFQMAITNKQLYPDFEVVFFMSSIRHSNLSSSIVKEIIHFNGDIRLFVPKQIAEYLETRK